MSDEWARHSCLAPDKSVWPTQSSFTKEFGMKLRRLLRRNLIGHWRGNLAVLLGVAVATAVLTGALLVGDSLRGSLHDLTLRQLGWVDHVLIGQHFIREELADWLQAEHACPAILLQGSANSSLPALTQPGSPVGGASGHP